jgi:microcystin-dependent protein
MDNGSSVPNSTGGYVDGGGGNIDRVPDTKADILGASAGQSSVELTLDNVPDHQHDMIGPSNQQYYATYVTTANPDSANGGLSLAGGTVPGQVAHFPKSGYVDRTATTILPVTVMNPYLTINYIIRSGPPVF